MSQSPLEQQTFIFCTGKVADTATHYFGDSDIPLRTARRGYAGQAAVPTNFDFGRALSPKAPRRGTETAPYPLFVFVVTLAHRLFERGNLFQQFLELHAGQAFQHGRQLADDGGHVAGQLARAAAGAVAAVDDDHLLGLAERFADLARHFRQHAHDHFDDRRLVVLLEALGLGAHRLGGRLALRLDDGGFGQTARLVRIGFGQTGGLDDVGAGKTGRLGRGSGAGGLGFELEFLRVGQRLDLVTFGVGGFLDGGFEFALLCAGFPAAAVRSAFASR